MELIENSISISSFHSFSPVNRGTIFYSFSSDNGGTILYSARDNALWYHTY